jgi:GH35 family endo-1,4-beta-xylanase
MAQEQGDVSDAPTAQREGDGSPGQDATASEDIEPGVADDETTVSDSESAQDQGDGATESTDVDRRDAGSPSDSDGQSDAGQVEQEPEELAPIPDFTDLREAAAAAGKLIGAAVREGALDSDAAYREILAREFDYVTPEDSAKWGSLEPSDDAYSWGATDTLVDFASSNAQAVKGHALIWHNQLPSWVNESMSADQLRNAMRDHIETTLDHYRGRMRAWDVVNEAVDTASASGYRESIFYEKLGPEYIADAFRWAREADPEVLLFYNDYGIERIGPKSDFTYELIRDLLEQQVPIDGVGFQSHIGLHRYPSESDLRENLQRFADLDISVNISEVDALTSLMPGSQLERWHVQRVAFQQIVSACVAVDGCEAITFWGFSDNYSWLNENSEQDPLLFDRNNQVKPAYEGVVHGLAGRRVRYGTNLLRNGDFSGGDDQWSAAGGQLTVSAAVDRDGNAACVSDREYDTDGLVQADLLSSLTAGTPYSFATMVRTSEASTVEASLLIERDGEENLERNITALDAAGGTWTLLNGDFGFGVDGTPTSVSLTLSGPDADVELCVSDVVLQQVTMD